MTSARPARPAAASMEVAERPGAQPQRGPPPEEVPSKDVVGTGVPTRRSASAKIGVNSACQSEKPRTGDTSHRRSRGTPTPGCRTPEECGALARQADTTVVLGAVRPRAYWFFSGSEASRPSTSTSTAEFPCSPSQRPAVGRSGARSRAAADSNDLSALEKVDIAKTRCPRPAPM